MRIDILMQEELWKPEADNVDLKKYGLGYMKTFMVSVMVASILAFAEFFSHNSIFRYLLFPPLASIAFVVFDEPFGRRSRFLSVVLMPTIGAFCGLGLHLALGRNALSVFLAAFITILLVKLLRDDMPSSVAVAELALILKTDSLVYPVSVFFATFSVYAVLRLWQRIANRYQEKYDSRTVGHG